jgi:hypothetical protein
MQRLNNSKQPRSSIIRCIAFTSTGHWSNNYILLIYKYRDILFVSAYNEKSSEMFLIELPKPKSLEVLSSFGNDYLLMCDNLDIQRNRLVILNPNRKLKKPQPITQKRNNNGNIRLESLNT